MSEIGDNLFQMSMGLRRDAEPLDGNSYFTEGRGSGGGLRHDQELLRLLYTQHWALIVRVWEGACLCVRVG